MGWWSMELANRAFDLVVKIAVILAAVAAINLLGEKPRLVAIPACHLSVDLGVLTKQYEAVARATPGWLVDDVRGFASSGSVISAGGVSLTVPGRGVLFRVPDGLTVSVGGIGSALTQRSSCAPIVLTSPGPSGAQIQLPRPVTGVVEGRFTNGEAENVLSHARPILGPSLEGFLRKLVREGATLTLYSGRLLNVVLPAKVRRVDDLARSAVAAATTIRADVRVDNRGRGGATNVRVEPPPPYEPVGTSSPFDLAPGEGRTLHFSVARGAETSAPQTPQFRPFGNKQQGVNATVLLGLGVGLGVIALAAFVNDVREVRRKRAPTPTPK